MNRKELEEYILQTYNTKGDNPWVSYPDNIVFRHENNNKWFALIMPVPKDKLGLEGEGTIDVVNFKCDPILIGSLRMQKGFFPAYHMSKDKWISVALDGSVPDETVKMLLQMSFEETYTKVRKKKNK